MGIFRYNIAALRKCGMVYLTSQNRAHLFDLIVATYKTCQWNTIMKWSTRVPILYSSSRMNKIVCINLKSQIRRIHHSSVLGSVTLGAQYCHK